MKKFLFGWSTGFFAGAYLLFTFLIDKEPIRTSIKYLLVTWVDKLVYGKEAARRSRYYPQVYSRYGNPIGRSIPRYSNQKNVPRRVHIFSSVDDNYIFTTKEDAQKVFNAMKELLSAYSLVRLSDFNDLIGFPSTHDDEKKGWTELVNTTIVKMRFGWKLVLPDVVDLETV